MPTHQTDERSEPQDFLAGRDAKEGGQIEELQEAIQRESDARQEERLIWLLVVIILLDVYFFTLMDSVMGPLVIGVLQLLAFILVAKKLGMEQVVQLIDRMIATVARGVSGKGD